MTKELAPLLTGPVPMESFIQTEAIKTVTHT